MCCARHDEFPAARRPNSRENRSAAATPPSRTPTLLPPAAKRFVQGTFRGSRGTRLGRAGKPGRGRREKTSFLCLLWDWKRTPWTILLREALRYKTLQKALQTGTSGSTPETQMPVALVLRATGGRRERRGQDSWKSASSPLPSTPASCLASVRKPLNRNRLRHAFLSEPTEGSRLGFLPPVCTSCAPLVHQPKTAQIAGGSKTVLSRYRPCQILASRPAREQASP